MVIGELGLDGRVKPVSGVLSLAAMAREKGIKRCFLPIENVAEGLVMEGGRYGGGWESLGHMQVYLRARLPWNRAMLRFTVRRAAVRRKMVWITGRSTVRPY